MVSTVSHQHLYDLLMFLLFVVSSFTPNASAINTLRTHRSCKQVQMNLISLLVNCGHTKSPEHLSQFSAAAHNLLIAALSICHNVLGNKLKCQFVLSSWPDWASFIKPMCVQDKLKGPVCKIYTNLLPESMGMFYLYIFLKLFSLIVILQSCLVGIFEWNIQ